MFTIRQRLRYSVDNLFSRGTGAMLFALSAGMVIIIVSVFVMMVMLGTRPGDDATSLDSLWTIFIYTFDPSGVPYNEGDWSYRILMFMASFGGIIVLSTLIGILATGFTNMLETLRKGKSLVIETRHTLILGWSEQIYSIVHELILANENLDEACVVVLAEKDKMEMEDALRARIPETGVTRIVCRSGSPLDITDLAIVRPEETRAVIIVAPDDVQDPDAVVVKILLALLNAPDVGTTRGTVVATMRDEDNIQVARIVAGERARLIPGELVISQIITQTCRQPGLSMVYTELLDFGGDELYIHEEPALTDRTFLEALSMYEDSTLFGLRTAEGRILVNPPMDTIIGRGDAVIALSKDDDTVVLRQGTAPAVDAAAIVTRDASPRRAENILVLGWNERGRFIMRELDQYVAVGTKLHLIDDEDHEAALDDLRRDVKNITLGATIGTTTSRAVLDAANVPSFDSVIVLADTRRAVQEADARTLMTLIHLRDIAARHGKDINIVTEMLDDRNRALATMDSTNDFIVSNKITSMLLTQIAENSELYDVFRDLFDAQGSELYLKPSGDYVIPGREVNFATVVAAAGRRGEIAVGVKRYVGDKAEVRVNIPKSEWLTFRPGDMIIVLAED